MKRQYCINPRISHHALSRFRYRIPHIEKTKRPSKIDVFLALHSVALSNCVSTAVLVVLLYTTIELIVAPGFSTRVYSFVGCKNNELIANDGSI